MSTETELTIQDVTRLLQDPSPENRAIAAEKVSHVFSNTNVTEKERKIAEEIFRMMLKDAAVRVRQALSESLQENADLPHDIAMSLSTDVDDVALPMIQNSVVLSESDLVEIVETRGETLQKAVASRPDVSELVSEALIKTDNEDVVTTLVSNDKAKISENSYGTVLSNFGSNEKISGMMAMRSELPVNVAERLVSMVSDQLREHIMTHHKISGAMATDLLLEAREKATVSLLDGNDVATDVKALVQQLHDNKRLTPTLVMRALCTGDTAFFEHAIAVMCQIPVINAYKIIHEGGQVGLKKAFEKAEIPDQFVNVASAALELTNEMVETGGDDREMLRQLIMERVLTYFEFLEKEMDGESIDYLIGKLNSVSASAA